MAAAKTFLAEAVMFGDAKSSPLLEDHPFACHGSRLDCVSSSFPRGPIRAERPLRPPKAGSLLSRQGAYEEALAKADEAIAACRSQRLCKNPAMARLTFSLRFQKAGNQQMQSQATSTKLLGGNLLTCSAILCVCATNSVS